jgi:hypothetical protein
MEENVENEAQRIESFIREIEDNLHRYRSLLDLLNQQLEHAKFARAVAVGGESDGTVEVNLH